MATTTWLIVLAAVLAVGLALLVFALWRHKRAASADVDLLGAVASVETTLAPEGSVLIRGELWRARLCAGADEVERGRSVRVVGASQHLLEVEPMT
ncbi:MAG TPA: NfeD family protein [Pyrinomonadaceae bacterium]|nr:NfeD family protein [Pyrinomonadaceae bacterium]